MQMDVLIGELLLRNNCVVVPKFGGFVATRTPASFDAKSGKLNAPSKSVLFNKQLTNSDGLLITAYASKMNCSYEQAASEIDSLVQKWQEELHAGKRLAFEKVGFLYLDNEKNIRFEQDRFFNLLLESFGMGQVQFMAEQQIHEEEKTAVRIAPEEKLEFSETPVIKLTPELTFKKKTPVETVKVHTLASTKNARKKIFRYVAAACILPIAFYSVWIPMKTDVLESGMFSFSDFNPFHKQVNSIYEQKALSVNFQVLPEIKSLEELTKNLPEDVTIYPLEFEADESGESDIFYVRIKEDSQTQEEKNSSTETPKETSHEQANLKNANAKFSVIAGCFSNENNAATFVKELQNKGFEAFSKPDGQGLIRVVAGTSDSNAQALQLVQRLQEMQIASWILK